MHGGVFGIHTYDDTQQKHAEIAVQALNKFAAAHVGGGLDAANPFHYHSLLMLLKGAVVGSVMGSDDVMLLVSMFHKLHGIPHPQCDLDVPALPWSPPEHTVERISGPAICFDDDGLGAMVQSWRFQLDRTPYFLVEDVVLLTGQQLLRPLYDQVRVLAAPLPACCMCRHARCCPHHACATALCRMQKRIFRRCDILTYSAG
jgi:hypothetical protein